MVFLQVNYKLKYDNQADSPHLYNPGINQGILFSISSEIGLNIILYSIDTIPHIFPISTMNLGFLWAY